MDSKPMSANGYAVCQVPRPSIVPTFQPIVWNRPASSRSSAQRRINCDNGLCWCYSCRLPPSYPMSRQRQRCTCTPTLSGIGGDAGRRRCFAWKMHLDGGAKPGFPPLDHALVTAIACEIVHETRLPLSRQSTTDVAARAAVALGKSIRPSTVWRILAADAIKPWRYRYWIFPRDPAFAQKAGRVLDLSAGWWQGEPLRAQDHIISADEKTSIQARIRCHPSLPPAPGRALRIEHEYERGGALQYLAAWDVRRGMVMGRCEPATGIVPFGRLVAQIMEREPYCSAERVFWIVDNGSSHRGQTAVHRLATAYTNLMLVHTPVHASWLNQVEISFSIIQRKVLTPNDFASLEEVERRLRRYEVLSNQQPQPFAWKFTRAKLEEFLQRLEAHGVMLPSGQTTLESPDTNQEESLAA
jgi:DDE superfamily endonuclease